jgi:hypothetical protein
MLGHWEILCFNPAGFNAPATVNKVIVYGVASGFGPMNRMFPITFRRVETPDEYLIRTVRSAELLGTLCVPPQQIRRGHEDEPYRSP